MEVETYATELGSVFVQMWENVVLTLPGIIVAILILALGFFISLLIRIVIEKSLIKLKLDKRVIDKTPMKKFIGGFKLSHFIALIIKWYVFILFLPLAADVLRLNNVSQLLMDLSRWIPSLIGAIFIAIVGIIVASYVKIKIEEINFHNALVVSNALYTIVLIFTFLIAFEQIGINISLVSNSFLIVLAGVMLALGLGFGLGMKSEAEKIIRSWRKKL